MLLLSHMLSLVCAALDMTSAHSQLPGVLSLVRYLHHVMSLHDLCMASHGLSECYGDFRVTAAAAHDWYQSHSNQLAKLTCIDT